MKPSGDPALFPKAFPSPLLNTRGSKRKASRYQWGDVWLLTWESPQGIWEGTIEGSKSSASK